MKFLSLSLLCFFAASTFSPVLASKTPSHAKESKENCEVCFVTDTVKRIVPYLGVFGLYYLKNYIANQNIALTANDQLANKSFGDAASKIFDAFLVALFLNQVKKDAEALSESLGLA